MLKRAYSSLSSIIFTPLSHESLLPHHLLPLNAMTQIQPSVRYTLPSVLMRSGTSKGLFLHRHHLPAAQSEWEKVLLSVMGSKNGDQKQLDGVGGGTSTTSKVAIVSKSARPGVDVDYTFAQVALGQEKVDFSGNCGNMACGVGPFALDEGLVQALPGQTHIDISVFNTNTSRLLVETVEVGRDAKFNEFGNHRIGGVKTMGSEIKVAFVDPAGSMTGKLFPTGNKQDTIHISSIPALGTFSVTASLVDAANPFIFVDAASLPPVFHLLGPAAHESLELIEAIRREGSVMIGLSKDVASAALVRGTPKIAVLSPPLNSPPRFEGKSNVPSIRVQSYSMGNCHPSFQLTGAVCLGGAVCINGTVANRLSKVKNPLLTPPGTPSMESEDSDSADNEIIGTRKVKIQHASGEMDVLVDIGTDECGVAKVDNVCISRTARRLFEGNVYYTS